MTGRPGALTGSTASDSRSSSRREATSGMNSELESSMKRPRDAERSFVAGCGGFLESTKDLPQKAEQKRTEMEGFEPPIWLPLYLISNQAPSAGLGHISTTTRVLIVPFRPRQAFASPFH